MLTTLKDVTPMFLLLFYSLGLFLLGFRAMLYALEDARNRDLPRYLFSMGLGACWFIMSLCLIAIAVR